MNDRVRLSIAIGVIIGAIGLLTPHATIGIGLVLILLGGFLANAVKTIPADPPTKGVLTRFGQRTGEVVEEGLRIFPFYPLVFGFIPVVVVKVNQELTPEEVRTPDLAELEVEVALTWTPYDLVEFINSGGEKGVRQILANMVEEEVRQWANSPTKGPKTWKEAIGASDDAVLVISTALGGCSPREKVRKALAIGNAAVRIAKLGITLNRLNVGKILVKGDLRKAAERSVVEAAERDAEIIELEHIRKRIIELKRTGLSAQQVTELIQTERGKVQKTVSEMNYGVSKDLGMTMEKVAQIIADVFKKEGAR